MGKQIQQWYNNLSQEESRFQQQQTSKSSRERTNWRETKKVIVEAPTTRTRTRKTTAIKTTEEETHVR